MQKATLTGGQVVAAVFAGIIGHVLFAIGWLGLGVVLLGGLIATLLGATITSLLGQFLDPATVDQYFTSAGGLVTGVFIGLLVGAVVFMLLGFLISAGILRGGKVRRPWATTLSAIVIVAILDVPLLFVYAAVAAGDNRPSFVLVAVLGTVVVGVLVWLWMTWGHRGPASQFAGVSASGTATAPVTAAPAETAIAPSAEAPGEQK